MGRDELRHSDEYEPTMIFDPAEEEGWSAKPGARPEDSAEELPGYTLTVQRGMHAGRKWRLSPGATRIGRHPSNDITLDDITVSRRHCRMLLDSDGRLILKDLGSTNGSYVNETLVEEARLTSGDRLMIGKFHLLVTQGR